MTISLRLRTLGAASRALLLSPLLVALGGCGDETPPGETAATGDTSDAEALTWWRDVEPIVREKCGRCHVEVGIAPFSLETHEAFVALAPALAGAIESGSMPPWPPDESCAELKHSRALSAAQKETLLNYIAGDMAEGDPADAPPDDGPAARELMPDLMLEMPESYTAPVAAEDDYRCFLIPWPEDITEPRFVTGLEVYPGDRRIVHHVIVYAVAPGAASSYEDRDAAEPGPGYTCFGGPGPTDGSARWIGGWVPGMEPFFAPEGVGQQIDPGTTLIMQAHYHPIGMEVPDRSSIGLELKTEVQRRAEVLPAADIAWLAGNGAMRIPAGDPNATHDVTIDRQHPILGQLIQRLGLTPDADLEIHNVGFHMHTFGARGRLELRDPTASTECLLDIPEWDFNWQSGYDLAQPVTFRSDQQLNVQCWWDNSAENQPFVDGKRIEPADLDWGEGTGDEMCLGILYLTSAAG